MIERNVVSFSFKEKIRSLEIKRKMAEEVNKEKLEKNLENFSLLTNKGVWIYILKTFVELNRKQVKCISQALKENKISPLSVIFDKANEILEKENNALPEEMKCRLLPEDKWKIKGESKNLFFDFVSFDYDFPERGFEATYDKLKEEAKEGNKEYIALKVADILGDKNAPVFKDLYALEGRGEIGIKVQFKENPGYNEIFYITGEGLGTARMIEFYFDSNIRPFLDIFKGRFLAQVKGDSNELKEQAS